MLGLHTNTVGTIPTSDTAKLVAYLKINGQPVTADQITSVSFIVQKPDATTQTVVGTVQTDGGGSYVWTDTSQVGQYIVQAQFTLNSGEVRSQMLNFAVYDPFNPPVPTDTDLITEQVQLRLEDLFDSIEGGPWLRDVTKANFDQDKIADFIPEALLDINVEMPPTNVTLDYFTMTTTDGNGNVIPNPNLPLLVKGVLVLTIRHLMRSYVEQPMPQGGQIVWEDRTRYTQLWQQVYQIEHDDFQQKLRLWKRTFLRLGQSALLTYNKAGRYFPFGNMQARGIYRGGGYGYY